MESIDSLDARHETSELHPSEALRTYWKVFIWLMVLLVLTVVAAQIHLDDIMPGANLLVAMIIATIKGGLVVLFFMHVKHASKLTWIFATAAFLWLGIAMALSFGDYLTRPPELGARHRPQALEQIKTTAFDPVPREE